MTENEAFYIIGNIPIPLDDENYDICQYQEAKAIALEALEEIQQYKALGTVEELRIAKEKQIPKKPNKNFEKFSGVWCSCDKYFGKGYFVDKPIYCPNCGQKLDWSDGE